MTHPEVGDRAPEFTLKGDEDRVFTQADLTGTITVLVFYPFAFSPVCTDQLSLYDDLREEFAARGAVLYGVSCDSVWYSERSRRSSVSRSSSSRTSSPGRDLPGVRRLSPWWVRTTRACP